MCRCHIWLVMLNLLSTCWWCQNRMIWSTAGASTSKLDTVPRYLLITHLQGHQIRKNWMRHVALNLNTDYAPLLISRGILQCEAEANPKNQGLVSEHMSVFVSINQGVRSEKVGVIDAEYVMHKGIPSLGGPHITKVCNTSSPFLNIIVNMTWWFPT